MLASSLRRWTTMVVNVIFCTMTRPSQSSNCRAKMRTSGGSPYSPHLASSGRPTRSDRYVHCSILNSKKSSPTPKVQSSVRLMQYQLQGSVSESSHSPKAMESPMLMRWFKHACTNCLEVSKNHTFHGLLTVSVKRFPTRDTRQVKPRKACNHHPKEPHFPSSSHCKTGDSTSPPPASAKLPTSPAGTEPDALEPPVARCRRRCSIQQPLPPRREVEMRGRHGCA
mmetsp:Transcript_6349/g.9718  ORF Transcript_6349/g.9718 Transcript_6349/m.9718 type:complete len:225 (+) Transcript_6349:391-1065(+)